MKTVVLPRSFKKSVEFICSDFGQVEAHYIGPEWQYDIQPRMHRDPGVSLPATSRDHIALGEVFSRRSLILRTFFDMKALGKIKLALPCLKARCS
ncbi:hypothetical protein D7T59_05515 [Stenotrophomonas maltophilia]|nr:hypothetical protein [Stenotrophomonas maltophilia]MBA0344160.1 hypothetical protein [Stenotrophomonas maltophilia]MBA0518877.1 hypothetical protein [Stenotrophomonas maltophilia]